MRSIGTYILLLTLVAFSSGLFGQAPPQGITYQAVVYDVEGSQMPGIDAENLVLANQDIHVRFTIRKDAASGTAAYHEDHYTTTDPYGLFTLIIGQGTQLSVSSFPEIDWGTGLHFLEVEIDRNGGNDFKPVSNSQFWSVPYALYADKSSNGVLDVIDNGDGTITFIFEDSTDLTIGPVGWSLTGNQSTDPTINFLGTTDATDLLLKTNTTERLRIDSNGKVGINTSAIDPSALLELTATDKGLRLTRLSSSQRDAISNPANGLVIFNTSDSIIEYFNGNCWLPTYIESCDECLFDLSLPITSGVIDRVFSDTIAIQIDVDQTSSPDQTISFFTLNNLPQFTTTYFAQDTIVGDGSTYLVVSTSIFDEPGMYPIAIQAVCGNSIQIEVFYLTIDSCYEVTVSNAVSQYNLQSFNSLPGVGTPICVVLDVTYAGEFSSTTPANPSYTSGALDPLSHVGIRNYGMFLGEGGDGGTGGNLSTFGEAGEDGGIALNMTCKTTILNYVYIFGGGGGGASVGLTQSISIPIIGTWTLGVGAGGGGGCQNGAGGGTGGTIIGLWDNGQTATGGLSAIPGQGGQVDLPINIPIGPVTITIDPDAQGGDGGNYGQAGTSGILFINASASIPIIGTINIPIPPITNFPDGGQPGNAIKKNNQILNGIQNGNYQLNSLKGVVND